MRQQVLILAAFLVLVGGGATTSGAGEHVDAAALGRVLEQWAVAWTSSDVDQLLPLFTDDVLYEDVPLGAVNQGKEALRNFATASGAPWSGCGAGSKPRTCRACRRRTGHSRFVGRRSWSFATPKLVAARTTGTSPRT